MANDPLAAFRTGPAPQDGGEPERHRSVADGDLHNPWSLKEFFGSLNSVMRLPTKARRKEKEKARSEGLSVTLPGIPGWMGKLVLYGGGAVAVTMLVVLPVIRSMTTADRASLTPVVGVWEAGKGKYQGRRFEMTDSAVVFRTGTKPTDYTWHRVQEVRVKQVADSVLYTVRYEEGDKTADMTFWYVAAAAPRIRLKNQPGVTWSKTNLVPAAGPPPPPPPRLGRNS